MGVRLHQHARDRLRERGATATEVVATVRGGRPAPAKFGRTAFRKEFDYNDLWRGRYYARKRIEAFAVPERGGWLVITVIVRFF